MDFFNDSSKKISDFFDKMANGVLSSFANLGLSKYELAVSGVPSSYYSCDGCASCTGGCTGGCESCYGGCQGGCTGCDGCSGGCQGYCTGAG